MLSKNVETITTTTLSKNVEVTINRAIDKLSERQIEREINRASNRLSILIVKFTSCLLDWLAINLTYMLFVKIYNV